MARRIIAREAIFAGMSSGAALLAAVRTAARIERGQHRGGLPRPCREVSQHDDVRRIQRLILRRMPRLSLIVATYNRAEQLLTTLRSVAAQTAPTAEWECVVVDNNSTDDTAARFEGVSRRIPGCRCGGCPRRGRAFVGPQPRHRRDDGRHRGHHRRRRAHRAGVHRRIHRLFSMRTPRWRRPAAPIVAEYPAGRPAWMSRYTERPIANPIDLGPTPRPFPRGRIPGGGNMALRRTALGRYGAFDPQLGRRGARLLGGEERPVRTAAARRRTVLVRAGR